jgi:hypothetical protein
MGNYTPIREDCQYPISDFYPKRENFKVNLTKPASNLGEYIYAIWERHNRQRRLSFREMSLEAGLSENMVYKLVFEPRGARPETLKAIADRWGTLEDYVEMMRLAGHPLPDELVRHDGHELKESTYRRYLAQQVDKDPTLGDLLQVYNELPPEGREELVADAKKLLGRVLRDKMRRLGLLSDTAESE